MNKAIKLINNINLLEKEVWDKDNPNKKSKKLTPEQKKKAKARAKSNNRRYPNAVDNIWAAQQ